MSLSEHLNLALFFCFLGFVPAVLSNRLLLGITFSTVGRCRWNWFDVGTPPLASQPRTKVALPPRPPQLTLTKSDPSAGTLQWGVSGDRQQLSLAGEENVLTG